MHSADNKLSFANLAELKIEKKTEKEVVIACQGRGSWVMVALDNGESYMNFSNQYRFSPKKLFEVRSDRTEIICMLKS